MFHEREELTDLLEFLNSAPTSWHAVDYIRQKLAKLDFEELSEGQRWNLQPKKKYFVIRAGSLCAFITPKTSLESLNLAASHTDSPGFKLKPNAEFKKENMVMLGLEIYGGPLLTSWLNRDLGIAGRIAFLDAKGKTAERLVIVDNEPVTIPQLAIHLDRNVNDNGLTLHKQEHLAALAAIEQDSPAKKKTSYLENLLKEKINFKEILSTDLFLYPLEPPRFVGKNAEMIAGYRIDSLASVHAAVSGLLNSQSSSDHTLKMLALWDHEEIGSHSAQGAGSPFIPQVIERIAHQFKLDREDYFRLMNNSLCASVDLAHALHPNYAEKHEPRHQTLMNKGIVIKTVANKRYATDAATAGRVIALCKKKKIPFQKGTPRGDIPCGTTIGPIHATLTGMPTVDIGSAQLSMHSCRELMGSQDHLDMIRLLTAFFES